MKKRKTKKYKKTVNYMTVVTVMTFDQISKLLTAMEKYKLKSIQDTILRLIDDKIV